MKNKGYFISFEGIDGSGKSTQIQKLAEFLEARDFDIVITREPGGSKGGEEIRNLLLQGNVDRWSAETEILLFTAARRDHLERIILPALEEGKIVICDRFTDSTIIYQGRDNLQLTKLIKQLHLSIIGIIPDLTLIIDVDPKKALNRGLKRRSKEMRFEAFGLEFQTNARNSYIELSKTDKRYHLVDGNNSEEKVHQLIWQKVYNFFGF